ncbi:MAG: hypothetical protein ACOC3G_02875 [Phycisphaeraceae bacterium]
MTRLRRFTSLLALCCAALLAVPASADAELPLSEHVPASAMVYAGWRGADEMQETYDQSRLKAVIEDAGLKDRWMPLFREVLAEGKQEMEAEPPSEQREQAMHLFDMADAIPEVAWRRPWAVYATDFDVSGEEPLGQIGFLIDAGPMRDQVMPLVDALVKSAREEDDVPVEKIDRDGVVGLVLGHALPEQKMGFTPADLPEQTVQEPALMVFADVAAGFDLLDRGIRKQEGAEEAAQALAVLDALGLTDMQSFVYMAGFEGKDWRTDLHMLVPAPRRGVFAMLEGRPLGDEDWQLLPSTATWATLFRFDPDDVMTMIREAIAASGEEEALEEFNRGIAEASQNLGIDIEKEILSPLGDTWAIYSEPTFATGFGPGVCVLHNADDGAQLERMLDAARVRINEMLRDEGPGIQITEMDMGGIEISSLSLPFVGVSWAVQDDRFYFAMSPNAVLTAHQAAGDPEQSLAKSEKFQRVRERLENLGAGENVISVSFTDLEQTAPRIYPTYAMLLNLVSGPLLQETGINAMTLLPPLGAILPHLEPAGGVTWFDDRGLHSLKLQPFPGSELLSPEGVWSYSSSVAPLSVGIMLPAMGAARQSARQSVSMSNLRQIVIAVMTYSADHNETLPPDLASLEAYMPLKEVLRSPSAPDAAMVDALDEGQNVQQRKVEDTRRWSSYVLIPWNLSLNDIEQPSELVVAFEKPHHAADPQRLPVAFLDGHVEMLHRDEADRTLRAQSGVSLDKWVEAAEAGKVPEGFDPDKAPGEATDRDAVEVQARPAEEASGSTAPPAPR